MLTCYVKYSIFFILLLKGCEGRSVEDVVQSFSLVISKLQEEVSNFSTDAYKRTSTKVNYVIYNNTNEFSKTMQLITQMQNNITHILGDSGMNYYPQLITECKNKFEHQRDRVERKAGESENICIVFIANVFQLIENPSLYRNVSDARLLIEEVEANCTNRVTHHEAQECFTKNIYGLVKPRIKELRRNLTLYYNYVDRSVLAMTSVLYNCYNTIRENLLRDLIYNAVAEFDTCIYNKKKNHY